MVMTDDELCERLRETREVGLQFGSGSISADGKFSCTKYLRPRMPINRGGLEAAARIEALSAQLARVTREARSEIIGTPGFGGAYDK
jgi:hypothetical protein